MVLEYPVLFIFNNDGVTWPSESECQVQDLTLLMSSSSMNLGYFLTVKMGVMGIQPQEVGVRFKQD